MSTNLYSFPQFIEELHEVEPFQLQLLCLHVENIVRKNPEQGFTNIVVHKDDLGGPAGMQQVLQNFYNDQIKRLGSFFHKRRARKLCENGLISVSDRRLSLEEEEIDRRFKISEYLLSKLVDSRLLRAEPRVGSVYYELSHDTLVEPIRESQRRRRFRGVKYGGILLGVTVLLVLFLLAQRMGGYKYYHVKGFKLYRQGKYSEAIESLNKAIELYPQYAVAYYRIGLAFFEQGKYDEAIKHYQKAIQLEPDLVVAYENLGHALTKKGKYDEALKQYQKAIQFDSNYTKTYFRYIKDYIKTFNDMGNVFEHQGRYEEAITCYQRVIQISPGEIEDYSRYRDRDDEYDEMIKNYFEAYNNLGRVLLHQGKYHEAIDYYRKALLLETDINYPYAYNNLGMAFKKQGNYDEAIENFKNALLFDHEYLEAYKNLGETLVHQGKYIEAIEQYQLALQLDFYDAELYNGLGIAYQKYRNYNEAIRNFQIAIIVDAYNPRGYNNLGLALMYQGAYDEAISSFQIALQLDPKLTRTYYNWGEALVLQGKYDEAIERYQQALQLDPTDVYGHKRLGNLLIHRGKFDEAMEHYQKALQLDPTDAYGYYELGNILAKLERYNEAIKNYQTAMNLDPENLIAKMNFVELCLRAGRFEKAFKLAREMLGEPHISPEGILAMQLISISSLFFQEKRFTALVELEDCIEYYKSLPENYERTLKYTESKDFIRNTEQLPETDKTLLLTLIEILESPQPQADKKLKELEALFAKAFEEPIIRTIFPQTH